MGKYINPFTDWGFKRLFGQEFSKPLLISFLNDLLSGELHVTNVTFMDKEQMTANALLLRCKTSGSRISSTALSVTQAAAYLSRWRKAERRKRPHTGSCQYTQSAS